MAFHIVIRGNRWKPGTIFEEFDDGVQECQMEQEGSRLGVRKHVGFIMPYSEIEPYVMRMNRRGLDRHLQQ